MSYTLYIKSLYEIQVFNLIFSSGGTAQKVVQGVGSNQQVLRIPASSSTVSTSGNVNVGQLQKIQIGNKIQYVRVIPSGGQKQNAQATSIRQTQPILPSTTKGANSSSAPISFKAASATGGQQVVKIALPSNYQQTSGVNLFSLIIFYERVSLSTKNRTYDLTKTQSCFLDSVNYENVFQC